MDSAVEEPEKNPSKLAKAISDLDSLIHAILGSLRPSKPWQRQLLQQLREVDRLTLVLRMTISMQRPSVELSEASEQLSTSLRVAQRWVAAGRADQGTKMAVLLAWDLGQLVDAAIRESLGAQGAKAESA